MVLQHKRTLLFGIRELLLSHLLIFREFRRQILAHIVSERLSARLLQSISDRNAELIAHLCNRPVHIHIFRSPLGIRHIPLRSVARDIDQGDRFGVLILQSLILINNSLSVLLFTGKQQKLIQSFHEFGRIIVIIGRLHLFIGQLRMLPFPEEIRNPGRGSRAAVCRSFRAGLRRLNSCCRQHHNRHSGNHNSRYQPSFELFHNRLLSVNLLSRLSRKADL